RSGHAGVSQNGNGVVADVGADDLGLAVAVEVGDADVTRVAADGEVHARREGIRTEAAGCGNVSEDGDLIVEPVAHDEVELAVAGKGRQERSVSERSKTADGDGDRRELRPRGNSDDEIG